MGKSEDIMSPPPATAPLFVSGKRSHGPERPKAAAGAPETSQHPQDPGLDLWIHKWMTFLYGISALMDFVD